MKFSTVAFLATVGSAAAFAPTQNFGRTAPLNMATEAAEETKVCFSSRCRKHSRRNFAAEFCSSLVPSPPAQLIVKDLSH